MDSRVHLEDKQVTLMGIIVLTVVQLEEYNQLKKKVGDSTGELRTELTQVRSGDVLTC